MAYTNEQKETILNTIFIEINKGRAVRTILKDEGMPDVTTFYRWIDNNEEKSKQYVRACENRADAIFDEIIDIADDRSGDKKVTEHGEVIDNEFIARSRLRIDARKWIASKLNPKKYGDKTDITSGGEKIQNVPTTIQVEITKPNED
jgi:hypothetical protein